MNPDPTYSAASIMQLQNEDSHIAPILAAVQADNKPSLEFSSSSVQLGHAAPPLRTPLRRP